MNQRNLFLIMALSCLGCEEKKEPAPAAPAPIPSAEPTPKAAEPEKPAVDVASAEAKAAADKEQAEVDENPLTGCCRSLGQKGFMERSPEYMGASQACGEALQAKKDLASVLPDIKKALKGKPLPDTCSK